MHGTDLRSVLEPRSFCIRTTGRYPDCLSTEFSISPSSVNDQFITKLKLNTNIQGNIRVNSKLPLPHHVRLAALWDEWGIISCIRHNSHRSQSDANVAQSELTRLVNAGRRWEKIQDLSLLVN